MQLNKATAFRTLRNSERDIVMKNPQSIFHRRPHLTPVGWFQSAGGEVELWDPVLSPPVAVALAGGRIKAAPEP
ncbi:unnamed protein product [Lota lota]